MRLALVGLGLTLSLVACEESHVGDRFRAERDLWKVDAAARRLGTSPRAWKEIAGRYEDVARRHLELIEGSTLPPEGVFAIAAQARIRAAQAHAAAMDSIRAQEVLEEIVERYAALPEVVGQTAWLRGRLDEAQGDNAEAIGHYEAFLASVVFGTQAATDDRSIQELPLHMARLASRGRETPDVERYTAARAYYLAVADTSSRDVSLAARRSLAQIAADLGEWNEAALILERLEREVLEEPSSAMHPMTTRLERVVNQMKAMAWGRADSAAAQRALESFAHDYPGNPIVAHALMARADAYADLGRTTNALRDYDRILTDHPRSPVAAEAALERARLLEKSDRWKEAYSGLRALEVEWPLSNEALQVPLEIARHERREGGESAFHEALQRAKGAYEEFLARYPKGPHTHVARQRLIETMILAGEHREAVDAMLTYARESSGAPRELRLLVDATRTLFADLADTAQAVVLLEETAKKYPGTRLGAQAAREATRLRQVSPR